MTPFTAPPEINQAARQISDLKFAHHSDYTSGTFDDFVKVDSFVEVFELESDRPASLGNLHVKGRLRAHAVFWEEIYAPPFIIECIREGYKIPFYTTPLSASFTNNRSALQHAEFVCQAILELLSSSRIAQVPKSHLKVINPLSVSVQSCGKKRLILDLRYVNKHLFKQKFKLEDWRVGLDYFCKGCYFSKFDLKSGYHHLDIFPEHQPYLGFSWGMPTLLPFGLSSAPYIFTKLFRPLVKHWRSQGIHSVVYLDDGLDVERSEALCYASSSVIRSDLASAGFLVNMERCVWDPVQVITSWLGIAWDGIQGVNVSITESRLQKYSARVDGILSDPNLSARDLASLVGQIISMSPVLLNLSNMTKHCQISVAAAKDWDSLFPLDSRA